MKNIKSSTFNIAFSPILDDRTAFVIGGGIFMEEIWKQVKGFEGLYFISSFGNIKNRDGLILKTRVQNSGYLLVHLCNGKRYAKTVHRLVADAFISRDENATQVNHINGIKVDNRIDNLEWVTSSQNMKDLFRSGRNEKTRELARERMRLIGLKYAHHDSRGNKKGYNVIKIDMDGNIVGEYQSLRMAEKECNCERHLIMKSIKNNTMYKGFTWSLKNN